jgi:hypothetical protein
MGLAVGMGAMFPQFNLPNPMTAVAGLGGILFMLMSLVYLAGLIVLSIPLTKGLDLFQNGVTLHSLWFDSDLGWSNLSVGVWMLGSIIGVLTWASGTYHFSLKLGSRQLEKKWFTGG